MDSTRQNKISRLIQKELSDLFQKQTQGTRGVLVSVSNVRISPDLSVAKVYLSIFPSEKAADLMKNINSNIRTIRYDSLDYAEHIDNLIKEAKGDGYKSPEGPEED